MPSTSQNNTLPRFGIVAILLLCVLTASGFDWKAKPNKELHADMVSYAEKAAKNCTDSKLAKALRTFAKKQKASNPEDCAWLKETHDFVRQQFASYPPKLKYAKQRECLFRILDYPLHVDSYNKSISDTEYKAYGEATQEYFNQAKEKILKQLKTVKPKKGMVIWKVYNMGFIFRTAKHTVGIDITSNPSAQSARFRRGNQKANTKSPVRYEAWPSKDIKQLVKHLDALLITHNHGDHISRNLIQAMLDAKKPVIMAAPIMHFDRAARGLRPLNKDNKHCIVLEESQETPLDVAGITVLAFRGNQGAKTPCNVYLLDIDGIRITHNGDNYDRAQDAKLAKYPAANIIITATWNDIINFTKQAQSAPGAKKAKQLLLPSHDNELGHTPDHRESYWELYTRADRMGNKNFAYPKYLVLNCGDAITYPNLKPLTTKDKKASYSKNRSSKK